MRSLALALVALTTFHVAQATPATEPWVFEGSSVEGTGAVGEPIEVTVRVEANTDLDETITLRAPAWVLVEGDAWHATARAGETVEHTWVLRPTDEGFWAAIASPADPNVGGPSCACALGFATGAPEAIVGATIDEAVPVPIVDRTLTTTPQDDGTVLLERAVTPVSSWLAHAEIRVWATPGSTYLCDSCAVRGPDAQHETRGRGTDTVILAARLPLADDEAYTLWDSVTVRFDVPGGSAIQPQRVVETGCENRRWGTEESWGCDTPSREWSHITKRSPVPGAGAWGVLGALAALGLAYRPPRGNRR